MKNSQHLQYAWKMCLQENDKFGLQLVDSFSVASIHRVGIEYENYRGHILILY